jgi:hypothetical protein
VNPRWALLVALLAPSLTMCQQSSTTVAITVEDFRILLEPASAPAGTVRFDITNPATGSSQSVHEVAVIGTALIPDELPTLPSGAVDQSDLTVLGEVEDIVPGSGATLEVDLEPGPHLVICNIRGHFVQGMVAPFMVT